MDKLLDKNGKLYNHINIYGIDLKTACMISAFKHGA